MSITTRRGCRIRRLAGLTIVDREADRAVAAADELNRLYGSGRVGANSDVAAAMASAAAACHSRSSCPAAWMQAMWPRRCVQFVRGRWMSAAG